MQIVDDINYILKNWSAALRDCIWLTGVGRTVHGGYWALGLVIKTERIDIHLHPPPLTSLETLCWFMFIFINVPQHNGVVFKREVPWRGSFHKVACPSPADSSTWKMCLNESPHQLHQRVRTSPPAASASLSHIPPFSTPLPSRFPGSTPCWMEPCRPKHSS